MGVRKKRDPLTKKGRRAVHRATPQPLIGGCYETSFPQTKKQHAMYDAGFRDGHQQGMQAGLVAGEQSARAKMEKDHQETLMKAQQLFLSAAGQSVQAVAQALGEAACFGRR